MSYLNNTIENKTRDFVLKEIHTLDRLRPVDPRTLAHLITNPFTGELYDGLILSGCFAEMDVINNNSRFYTEENYLPFIDDLKERILLNNGIFGTLEHPKDYATNANEISHKVIDIWYNAQEKKVYGTILVLNNAKGQIIQEIYKSGSWLSISARGGGKEIDQPNGTKKSILQLIVTFDVVTHPGFTMAAMNKIINPALLLNSEFTQLNENQNLNVDFYSVVTYTDNDEKVSTQQLFESNNYIFEAKRLSKEEKAEENSDVEKLEKNEPSGKNSIEHNLQNAVEIQLKESTDELKKRIGLGSKAYFDGAAGFKQNGMDGISNPGQVGLMTQSKNKKLFESVIKTKKFVYNLDYFKECIFDYNISLDEISELYEISETIVNSITKNSMDYEEARQYVLDFTGEEKIKLTPSRFNFLEKLVTNTLSGTKYKLQNLLKLK